MHKQLAIFDKNLNRFSKMRKSLLIALVTLFSVSAFAQDTIIVQTLDFNDITKRRGWGWYYLSTILDDYSRFIVTWKLCPTMKAEDVKTTLDEALLVAETKEPPKLLSDNGSCYISNELADYLQEKEIKHVRGRPLHPQTQGKIERYHRSMKNVVKLDNYFSPGQLEEKLKEFVHYYNYERYHESINNLTPAEVYYGKEAQKLKQRKLIKNRTLNARKKQYQKFSLN